MSETKHTFIISDESVNRYGYRILTDGIDTTQFEKNPVMYLMHDRFSSKAKISVIGRWDNVRKEKGQLLADAVFDMDDELGKEVARKVEKGFLRMASPGVDPVEVSEDPKLLLKGQTRGTVVKGELLEISIVDRGGNNNALRLCNSQGESKNVEEVLPTLELFDETKTETKPDNTMSDFKTIALALNLAATASENQILEAITGLKDKGVQLADLQKKQKEAEKAAALELVDKLVAKEVINEDQKEIYLAAFEKDPEGTTNKMKALLPQEAPAPNEQLGDFIETKTNGGKGNGKAALTYEELQKDPAKALKLQAEDPAKFNQLLEEHLKD